MYLPDRAPKASNRRVVIGQVIARMHIVFFTFLIQIAGLLWHRRFVGLRERTS